MFYHDRLKALIKYRNNHVAPTEIENLLQVWSHTQFSFFTFSHVLGAMRFGVKDEVGYLTKGME